MNAVWPQELETELPLHVHRQAMPEARISYGRKILRALRDTCFFFVFIISLTVVGVVMMTKGLVVAKKKADLAQDDQNKVAVENA